MHWDDLRFLLAVSREGTLQRAAASLGVAHTTVGRRLKGLETQLGVRLFERHPRGLVATSAGEELAAVAERVEDEVLSAEGRVLGQDARLRGPLRVSTVEVLFVAFEAAFSRFLARYPNIDLTLSTTAETVSLTRREADVVLRMSDTPPETLVGRKVGYVQFGLYASVELVERIGQGAALRDYPWIGWGGGENLRWFEEWLVANAPGARIALRMDYKALLMAHAVRSGLGAQILPCFLADPDAALVRIAPLDPIFRRDLWLLTLPELRTNSRVRVFMAHMAESLVARRALLAGAAGTS